MGCAIGIFLPISSLYLEDKKTLEVAIGIISSVYFLAMMISSNVYSKFLGKWKSYQIVGIELLLGTMACLLYMNMNGFIGYAACVFIIGFGVGTNFVTVQSCLNQSESKNKAAVTGTYSLFYTIGFGAGSVLGSYLYGIIQEKAFLITAALMLIDAALVAFFRINVQYESNKKGSVSFRVIGILVFGGALYGYIENASTTFLPIYAREYFSEKWNGLLLGAFVIGGLIGIIPLSAFSEKVGVYRANVLYSVLAILGLGGIALTSAKLFFAVITGAFVCTLYPITLAGLNQLKINREQVLCATGIYTLFYSAGSTIGPCFAGISVKLFGNNGLFYICMVLLLIYLLINVRKIMKEKKKREW